MRVKKDSTAFGSTASWIGKAVGKLHNQDFASHCMFFWQRQTRLNLRPILNQSAIFRLQSYVVWRKTSFLLRLSRGKC